MQALRLKLFQETACYKKPLAFKIGETYPLPPYSTVKGMLHALLDATEYIPMRISIQGRYDTLIIDYQSHYFIKKMNNNQFPLIFDGLAYAPETEQMTKMPLYMHLLYNINLIIHVDASPDVLQRLITGIESGNTHLSLGRWEDLVRIDEYKLVDINLSEIEETMLDNNAYVPNYLLPPYIRYIPYRLNFKYQIKHGIREWEKISVGYVKQGTTLVKTGIGIELDQDNYPVLFHERKED